MRKLFTAVALSVCGPLLAYAPVALASDNRDVQARYYWQSAKDMTFAVQANGVIKFVDTPDGKVNFTTMNTTGQKPSADASLAWFGFGRAPVEIHAIVNRPAYLASKARLGEMWTARVLLDRETKAGRPDEAAPDIQGAPKNLG